jgi:hypothetical protein
MSYLVINRSPIYLDIYLNHDVVLCYHSPVGQFPALFALCDCPLTSFHRNSADPVSCMWMGNARPKYLHRVVFRSFSAICAPIKDDWLLNSKSSDLILPNATFQSPQGHPTGDYMCSALILSTGYPSIQWAIEMNRRKCIIFHWR